MRSLCYNIIAETSNEDYEVTHLSSRELPAHEQRIQELIRAAQDLQESGLRKEAEPYFRLVFEEIVRYYLDEIVSFCGSRLGNNADHAKDVAQEVLLSVFGALPNFRGQSSIRTWLFAIARNKSLDDLRRSHRSRMLQLDIEEFSEDLRDPRLTAEERYQEEEKRHEAEKELKLVQHCLRQLSPIDRQIIMLSCRDGYTSQDIARFLSITPSNVRVRLMRAHKRMRELLKKSDNPPTTT